MIEVEVKLPLYRRSLTEKALIELRFTAGDLIREYDVYFNSESHDFIRSDEALRIRTSENMTKRTCRSFLTYKGKKVDSISMTREELETEVADGDTAISILNALSYQSMFHVKKLRQLYHGDGITACIDQVEDLGSFLELEMIVEDESRREDALNRIKQVLEGIGSDMSETTRISYLGMLMRKAGLLQAL